MRSLVSLKALVFTTLILGSLANSVTRSYADEITTVIDGRQYSFTSLVEEPRVSPGNPGNPGFPGFPSPPTTCIQNCTQRYGADASLFGHNPGECKIFGADFCGWRPSCVLDCAARYGADASIFGHSPGECKTYLTDVCGTNPVCNPSCTARYGADANLFGHTPGECKTYAADRCSAN